MTGHEADKLRQQVGRTKSLALDAGEAAWNLRTDYLRFAFSISRSASGATLS